MPEITATITVDDVTLAAIEDYAAGQGLTVREIADRALSMHVESITRSFEQSLEQLVPQAYRKATVAERVALIQQVKALAARSDDPLPPPPSDAPGARPP